MYQKGISPNLIIEGMFILLVVIFLFLILREFYCWYWKVNERVQKLNNIDKNLQFIVDFIKEYQDSEKNAKQ